MKNHSKLWSVIAVLILATAMGIAVASGNARAAGQWYVTPGGNNGNSCLTPVLPCATINGAIGKASSGDTIYMAVGFVQPGPQTRYVTRFASLSAFAFRKPCN